MYYLLLWMVLLPSLLWMNPSYGEVSLGIIQYVDKGDPSLYKLTRKTSSGNKSDDVTVAVLTPIYNGDQISVKNPGENYVQLRLGIDKIVKVTHNSPCTVGKDNCAIDINSKGLCSTLGLFCPDSSPPIGTGHTIGTGHKGAEEDKRTLPCSSKDFAMPLIIDGKTQILSRNKVLLPWKCGNSSYVVNIYHDKEGKQLVTSSTPKNTQVSSVVLEFPKKLLERSYWVEVKDKTCETKKDCPRLLQLKEIKVVSELSGVCSSIQPVDLKAFCLWNKADDQWGLEMYQQAMQAYSTSNLAKSIADQIAK
ncbi:MAG: hypothetical protein BWK78_02355 [Thiotrichaceae bacterium IS1]|nr:MAG: hypothetical protein BWK78_02355 [Thiotrichaceae bacterium IS1]